VGDEDNAVEAEIEIAAQVDAETERSVLWTRSMKSSAGA
jgi:hypothetical protein